MSGRHNGQPQTITMKSHAPNHTTILIIDDDENIREQLSYLLLYENYTVHDKPNGKEGLEHAKTNPPTLILLDITMPEMDGHEVCTRLKQNKITSDIPVIFISAQNDVKDIVKSFYVGGVDYVNKPFDHEEVLARVKAHIAIQRHKTKLKAQVAELDAFAHTVAHDLKGPLSLVTGFSDYLIEKNDFSDHKEMVDVLHHIKEGGHRAINITDELLLLSSVQKQAVILEPIDMASVVQKSQQRMKFTITKHEGQLEIASDWPVALGYAPWLEEVWVNYISNGLKYGGSPPILKLGAESMPDDEVCFWVSDNGKGLSSEQKSVLFAEFKRLDQVYAEGYGLGLSIVHRIIHKLGGTVGIKNTKDEGSLFYFTLPAVLDHA